MTTREMIEVMEAFERGEEIQYARKGSEDWFVLHTGMWHWDDYDYRIKPKRKKRHPEGVSFVYRREAGISNPKILVITSVETPVIKANKKPYEQDEAIYILTGIKTTDKNAVVIMDEDNLEKELIRVDDCLWYWEYQTIDGDWRKLDYRYATEQAQAVMTLSQQKTLAPLYALGFRLPKEQ
ncbi:hypothetical protein [Campylobacter sp. RM16192]|uniref:hypothetical protein n=1 Tax=Campylobacter sp. RM16192 TaxID=1660080 RepID=UPI00145207DF|nr:hypothetical protein [Campylobacter sp. RM16192]QCD52844.1 hypothetical protein CDOMC_1237 [Campylobacter sp. RM16192]